MEQVGKALEENRNLLLRTLDVAAVAIASKLWWDNTKSRPVSLIAFVTDTPDGNIKDLEKICEKMREKHKELASIINPLDVERDEENQTAFAVACRLGKPQFVKYFLDAGCSDTLVNSNGWLPIHLAALTGKQGDEIVRLLLEHNKDNATAKNDMNGWNAFHIAISKNSFKQIPLYLHTNLNATTASGHSPIMIASCEGLTQWVTELISRGVDLSHKELAHRETALHYASINGHSTIVQLLVDAGAEVNATTIAGATPLHYACAKGHVTIVKYLLQHGADVNIEKSDGFTPLHNVAVKGNVEIAELLIQKGSKLNTKSKFGRSPLHEAAYIGNYDVAKLLVDAGAEVNCIDNDGLTPLHTCCGAKGDGSLDGFVKIVDLLIDNGADVNYMWNENCTALHKAACAGDRGVVLIEKLLSRGGDATIENCLGWTPLHWANSEYGTPASVTLIENHLKSTNPSFLQSFDKNKPKDFDRKSRSDRPLINISEQEQHDVLEGNLTLEGIAQRISSGKSKKIVVLTGAGISVSAGIPDFRSPNGVYSSKTSEQYGISANVFDLHSLQSNPGPFYSFCKDTFLPVVKGTYKPTAVHHFIRLLHNKGLLLRNYTQNIDMLERMAGVPGEKMVEAHGTFADCRCMSCNKPGNSRDFWDTIDSNDIPMCSQCNAGILRPNVVFFGEGLPSRFADLRLDDLRTCDMLIVMGTSLMVYPFAGLVNEVAEGTPRLLINRDPVGVWRKYVDYPNANKFNYRDVSYLGNCDDGIRELAKLLGWQEELQQLETNYVPELSV